MRSYLSDFYGLIILSSEHEAELNELRVAFEKATNHLMECEYTASLNSKCYVQESVQACAALDGMNEIPCTYPDMQCIKIYTYMYINCSCGTCTFACS